MTEAEVTEEVTRVVDTVSPTFVFGYLALEDVKQIAWQFAIELLNKRTYDPGKPLANYLYVHVKRRLLNMRRDLLRRSDPPCRECHNGGSCRGGGWCERYEAWVSRNNAKANLMEPLGFDRAPEQGGGGDEAEVREALLRIDEELPAALRADYLKMRAGVAVPKARREAVLEAVRGIVGG
jgi:hypothetical protein